MKKLILALALICLTFTPLFLKSCTDSGTDAGSEFVDRQEQLANFGNNIIIPSYRALQVAAASLDEAADDFSDDPGEANLTALQNRLKDARLVWQDANLFQFGPAESLVLRSSLNTYPADTNQINDNIESSDYNLETAENQAARGFPTVGFLLHGVGNTNQEIIAAYTSDSNSVNRMAYLQDNIDFIRENADAVLNAWTADGGNYIATFLSEGNSGTDVGSSLGMLLNAYILHYERFLRDGKIGIPSGVRSAGVARPSATEAFYAGYSLELAIANMQAFQRVFTGTGLDGGDGIGLEENLNALDAQSLSSEIVTEVDQATAALQDLSDPLSQQIENNNEPVTAAFQEMQDIIVLVKADMASILGVTITFQDNDGD